MSIDKLKESKTKLEKFYFDDSKIVIIDLIDSYIKAMESGLPDIEVLSEKIHQAYCKYHIEKNGIEYWTKGDYSKLDEATKEYDRRTAKVVLDLMLPHLVAKDEKIRELELKNKSFKTTLSSSGEINHLYIKGLLDKIEQLQDEVKRLEGEEE